MIHVSPMTGKLEGLVAINTNTLSNPFCTQMRKKDKLVCAKCYAAQFLLTFRQNTVPALERNSVALSSSILDEKDLPFLNVGFVRYNAYGELINMTHLVNLCNIAEKNPHASFALWTKRDKLVQKYHYFIPKNMILIYSTPKMDGIPVLPEHFHKVFTVHALPSEKINCSGSCMECLICYKHGGTQFVHELVKGKTGRQKR